jgi:dTDP-4-dehydrorhamnose reductase
MAILIFGASGFLGGKLIEHYVKAKKKAIGTYSKSKKQGLLKFDLENPDLKSLSSGLSMKGMSLKDFTHAVICSSVTEMDLCKTEPEKTYAINVTGTKKLISQLFDTGIIPVFISTDYVFDGSRGNYSEEDERKPVLAYGKHKKEVEDYLMGSGKNYLIVRSAKLYDITGDDKVITGLTSDLKAGKQLSMATDQILSPTYVRDVCRAIEILIDRNITGCYNVCSDKAISRYELATIVKKELGIKEGGVKPCSIKEFKFEDKRPLNTSMNNKRFKELTGFKFTALKEVLKKRKSERMMPQ